MECDWGRNDDRGWNFPELIETKTWHDFSAANVGEIAQAVDLSLPTLRFEFGPTTSDVVESYPKKDLIFESSKNIKDMSLEQLYDFEYELEQLISFCVRKLVHKFGISYFSGWLKEIADRKKFLQIRDFEHIRHYYLNFIRTDQKDFVTCGTTRYPLFDVQEPLVEYDKFINVVNENCLSFQPTEIEFQNWLEENCSVLWGKVDRIGCEIPFDEVGRGSVARNDNFEALKELPYPRKLIMFSVNYANPDFGNPAFCHMVCWWFDQMIKKFNLLDTLEKMIIYNFNCQHIALPHFYKDNNDN